METWSRGGHRGQRPNSQSPGLALAVLIRSQPLLQEAQTISPSLNPGLAAKAASRPSLSPSRVLLVPLLAQGSLQSRGHSKRRGDAGALGTPLPATGPHLCEAGLARGRAPARGSGRRRLSLTHSRGRNADGRAALWSRLRPTDVGRRPGTQPVGLGSPPSC